jgi:chemotaxis protein MotB
MRRGKKEIDDQENAERWLLTYADLITLLLAFFIVMYSMSKIDAKKFGRVQTQLSNVLRGGNSVFPPGDEFDSPGTGMLRFGDLNMMQKRIQKKFAGRKGTDPDPAGGDVLLSLNKSEDLVTTELGERGLTIHIKDQALFESGKAELRKEAVTTLDAISGEMRSITNHICIEGHTDDVPISTPRFPSNWELSTARATTVLRYLVEDKGFNPKTVSARGFGEFRPVASNLSDKGRSTNRRVDIVILSQQLTAVEPQAVDAVVEGLSAPSQLSIQDTFRHVAAEPDRLQP